MLVHPTLDQLKRPRSLRLGQRIQGTRTQTEARSLDHAEWLGLLLEYELTLRRQKQFRNARQGRPAAPSASVEDVDYQSPRGLDRALSSSSPPATGSPSAAICS